MGLTLKLAIFKTPGNNHRFLDRFSHPFRILAFLFALFGQPALANVIDSIDISKADGNALITIHFTTEIHYLRHGPDDEGKFLRIFFRITKPGFAESEVMQENLRSPASDLIPRFSLTYPELVNGMLITFTKPTKFTVRPGEDNRSIYILVPLPPEAKVKRPPEAVPAIPGKTGEKAKPTDVEAVSPPKTPTAPVAVPMPAPETPVPAAAEAPQPLSAAKVEALATAFLDEALDAFAAEDYPKAINRLNRVLGLPTNAQTERAQALIGQVREKNGEIAKARAEYELYLKLFPKGEDAAKIQQRLAALPSADVVRSTRSRRIARDEKPAEWQVNGSLSSYYFTGRSKVDSASAKVDQKSLISSASVNARLRDSVTDTRIVFRDTDNRNILNRSRNYNRVYSAYAERTDRDVGYFVRAGRQNPAGGGVLERFDGVNVGYNLNADWRINGVYGDAVEFNSPFKKRFYGGSIELSPQLSRPGASLYMIEQDIDGYLNRRAVGSEVRYFDGQFTSYGMLDYDVLYKGINIAALQGNFLDQRGDNYFISYDYRKSPSYSLTNALAMTGYTTINDLIGGVGINQARTLVVDSTAASSMFAAGVTIPVGERWQFGADYRMSSISGTNVQLPLNQICKSLDFSLDPNDPICVGGPRGDTQVSQLCATNTFDPSNNTCTAGQGASGRTNMYSAQAIGTNLFVTNAVGVANFSWIEGPNYSGQNFGLNYIFPFNENWRLESNLRYYTQKTTDGQNARQFSPSLKLSHQWRNSLFVESEIGYNDSRNSGTFNSKVRREYLYVGLRWDYH